MIKSIKEYKDLKKLKAIAEDLEKIDKLLTTCDKMLNPFKKYKYVMEILSVIQNSQLLIKMNIKKYNNVVSIRDDNHND